MDYQGHADGSAKAYSLEEHGPSFQLSPHFRLIEFASRDGADTVLVHPALIDALEAIREHFGKPVHINSGYRTKSHNRAIRGSRNSRHTMGLAADIDVRGVHPDTVADFAETLQPGGLGRYHTFTHVDVEGVSRRWDER